jgi:hypothetical protein
MPAISGNLNGPYACVGVEIYPLQYSAYVIEYEHGNTALQAYHQLPSIVTSMTVRSNIGTRFHSIQHALHWVIQLRMDIKIFS